MFSRSLQLALLAAALAAPLAGCIIVPEHRHRDYYAPAPAYAPPPAPPGYYRGY